MINHAFDAMGGLTHEFCMADGFRSGVLQSTGYKGAIQGVQLCSMESSGQREKKAPVPPGISTVTI